MLLRTSTLPVRGRIPDAVKGALLGEEEKGASALRTFLTPLTSASLRSRYEDSSTDASMLVGPPRAYTPV